MCRFSALAIRYSKVGRRQEALQLMEQVGEANKMQLMEQVGEANKRTLGVR